MPGIDDNLMFRSLNIALVEIPCGNTQQIKESGSCLQDRIVSKGHCLAGRRSEPIDPKILSQTITALVDDPGVDGIITIGGVGLLDQFGITETMKSLFDKTLDGFEVLVHQIKPRGDDLPMLQTRPCAGLIGATYVFCLPRAPSVVCEIWDQILDGALDSRYRPRSLVDLIPRLSE